MNCKDLQNVWIILNYKFTILICRRIFWFLTGKYISHMGDIDKYNIVEVDGHISLVEDITKIPNHRKITSVDFNKSSVKYANYRNITKIDLSRTNITTLQRYCFYMHENLSEIILPYTLRIIDDYCFSGCASLISINIPDSITHIKNSVFYGCGLVSISLPSSVIYIGCGIFRECIKLVNVELSQNIKILGTYTFYGCRSLEKINIPSEIVLIGYRSFAYCVKLHKVTIKKCNKIAHDGFWQCHELKSITVDGYVIKRDFSTLHGDIDVEKVISNMKHKQN